MLRARNREQIELILVENLLDWFFIVVFIGGIVFFNNTFLFVGLMLFVIAKECVQCPKDEVDGLRSCVRVLALLLASVASDVREVASSVRGLSLVHALIP